MRDIMKKIFSIITFSLCVALLSAQTVDRSIRPTAAPAKEINIKDATVFSLTNGLKVFVVEDHRTPIVYYSLQLDVKPALEGNKAGLQDIFGGVMGTATKSLSKEELNKEIDLIGAKINASAKGGSGSGLKKYESRLLELLSDIILNPAFVQEELDLNKEKAKSELQLISDNPAAISARLSPALAYGKNFPDGEVTTLQTIDNITLNDLEKFYQTYFAPNVTRLVIVGDITEAEAKANAQKYFGDWKKREVPVAAYTIPKAPDQTKVAMFHKEGAVQSIIGVTYPVDFKPGAPDAIAAVIANYTLGGGASGRLFQNLREQHSYTYGTYSSLTDGELTGLFEVISGRGGGTSVKASATDSALTQVIYEMNRIANTPITHEDLKAAKAFIAGNFGRSLQNSSRIATFAVNIDKYNLPKDYYKNYLKRLEAVTVADVQAAAKKYITPQNAYIVVVGDKSHADKLKSFAANKTVQFYDINANPVAATETKPAEITPSQIIDNYVKALGGVEAINTVIDYKMTGTVSTSGYTLEITQLFKKPNLYLMSVSMSGMVAQKVVFDGTTLKTSGMGGSAEFTEGTEFDNMKATAALCPEMNYIKNGYKLTVGDMEKINGKEVYVLRVNMGQQTITDYYDVTTGLKIRTSATMNSPMGQMQQITDYSDYRPVKGVNFPHSMKQKVATNETVITITKVEVNTGISINDFK